MPDGVHKTIAMFYLRVVVYSPSIVSVSARRLHVAVHIKRLNRSTDFSIFIQNVHTPEIADFYIFVSAWCALVKISL